MFKALEQRTREHWGLKRKEGWNFDGLEVWDEVAKGNFDSTVVGQAMIAVAARVVNDHFSEKTEWRMNQPELFEFVIEKVFETRVVGGGLLRKFPERPSRGAQVYGYLFRNAESWLYEIIGKLVNRERIAPEVYLDVDSDSGSLDTGKPNPSFDRKIAAENSKIIEREAKKALNKKTEKEGKKKKEQKPVMGRLGHLSKTITNPEERMIIEEGLAEKLEEVKRKGQRVSQRMEEAIARAEGTRVMLGMDRKFYNFPSVDEMVLSCEDLTPLDDYYFVHIPKDADFVKDLYPEDQHGVIQEMNEGSLRSLRERMDCDGTVIGFPLWEGVSLRLTDPNAYGVRLYSESDEINGLSYDEVLEAVDAWQMYDLKKKSHLFLYRTDREQIDDEEVMSEVFGGVFVLFDGDMPVSIGGGAFCAGDLRRYHASEEPTFSTWTYMRIREQHRLPQEIRYLEELTGLKITSKY